MKYMLRCLKCNELYKDNGYFLDCHPNALLRTKYFSELEIKKENNILKYFDWLPMERHPKYSVEGGPVTYKSEGLGKELGLKNLFISFNGYFPDIGANTKSCSFKEFEAVPTIQRIQQNGYNEMMLSSAGNTARAFLWLSPKANFDLNLVVPKSALKKLWIPEEGFNSKVLVVNKKDFDYANAIELSRRIAEFKEIKAEGGTKNIARRDGMGTVLLDAFFKIKKMPQHYFQAVGSGAGGIAAYEAGVRLKEAGLTDYIPRLHLSQNSPFTPMADAWESKSEEIRNDSSAKEKIASMYSTVLSNRNPAYSILGGVYDALTESSGLMYGISNSEALEAKKLFEGLEGFDISEAPSVAVGSLLKAVNSGKVGKEDIILLNITGGGEKNIDKKYFIKDYVKLDDPYIDTEDIVKEMDNFK